MLDKDLGLPKIPSADLTNWEKEFYDEMQEEDDYDDYETWDTADDINYWDAFDDDQ